MSVQEEVVIMEQILLAGCTHGDGGVAEGEEARVIGSAWEACG